MSDRRIVQLWNRVRGLARRTDEAEELAEEMQFHREMLERDGVHAGLTATDARYAARRRLGNEAYLREESGEMWRIQPIETITQDLRYALRFLRRSPAFTAVAVLSLALGIGANTAIFSLINAISVRPLPVRDPEQLVLLEPARGDETRGVFPHPNFRTLDSANTVFDGLFAVARDFGVSMDRGNGPEPLLNGVSEVSGKYFGTLGVQPALGRLIGPQDDVTPDGHPVVVLSHELWQVAFGGDSSVVGRTIEVNDRALTIIGVSPKGFFGTQVGERSDIYIPLMMAGLPYRAGTVRLTERGDWWLFVMGRLKPGVTRERAAAELSTLFKRDLLAHPPVNPNNARAMAELQQARVVLSDASSGLAGLRRRFQKPLTILSAMAAVVLLIACTNLASLLSARAAARRREIAIRLSMGAGRQRLLRQLLTESALLSAAGGAVGILLAYLGANALLAIASRGRNPLLLEVTPDARVLSFTMLAAVLTALLFGIVPALQATRLELAPTLRSGGAAGRGRGAIRLGKVLIATQVALSVLLVFGGSLFVRSLQRLHAADLGFNQRDVVAVRVDPRRNGYRGGALRSFYDDLVARAATLPGVTGATLTTHVPFSGSSSGFDGQVEGYAPPPDQAADITRVIVADNYFRTLGVPLRSGRLLDRNDVGGGGGPRAAVVNESFVKAYVPSGQPLGKRFFRRSQDTIGITIVGVVPDLRFNNFREPTPPIAYWLYGADTAFGGPAPTLLLRIDPKIPSAINSVRSMIATMDRRVEVLSVRPLEATIDATISNERIVASLAGFFGIFALILAMIGLYGLMAYAVTSRTRELGIRIALGAEGQRVARSVLKEAVVLVGIGIAIGIPAALVAARVGRALLYGLEPSDAPTLGITVALLTVVALLAAAIPAWRASRIDPVGMLRTE